MPMKILAITSQKGGVGKTTVAINLAVAAAHDGVPTVVFDLDPQSSATAVYDMRVEKDHGDQPMILSIHAARLPQALKSAIADGYELAIIDSPPNVGGEAVHISQAGDLVLIPVQPAGLDLAAIVNSMRVAEAAGVPAAVVLNRCRSAAKGDVRDAQRLIENEYAFRLAPVAIGDRVAFARAPNEGLGVQELEPGSKGANEVRMLWKWVKQELGADRAAA